MAVLVLALGLARLELLRRGSGFSPCTEREYQLGALVCVERRVNGVGSVADGLPGVFDPSLERLLTLVHRALIDLASLDACGQQCCQLATLASPQLEAGLER